MTTTLSPKCVALLSLFAPSACDLRQGSDDWEPPVVERAGCSAPAVAGVDLPAGFEAVEIAVGGPLTHISGMALHPDGRIFVSDLGELSQSGDEAIIAIEPDTGATTTILSGLPLGAPGRLTFSDGRAPGGHDLVVADWNTELTSACCGGHIWRSTSTRARPPRSPTASRA